MKKKSAIVLSKNESPYNPEFVKRILASEISMRAGNYIRITLDEIYNEHQ
jgi:hypothetical protein